MNKLIIILIVAATTLILSACYNKNDAISNTDYTFAENWDEWQLHTSDGVNLFVREIGVGESVIVLHGGWGAEHSYLLDAFTNIADKYHFVFYDQRGSLRSPCSDTLISVAKHIEDVEELRKELGLEKVILVGHSMGGFLGMSYLEKYPENVKGLVLISTIPASPEGLTQDDFVNMNVNALKRWERQEIIDTLGANGLAISGDFTSRQHGTWHRITQAALNTHNVKNWRKMRSCFYYNQTAATAAGLTMAGEWDFTKIIEKMNIPVTVIHGDDDFMPLDWHKGWTSNISNVELKVIENAGHNIWIDQPDIFKSYILSALKKY
jgi:proline-specific peptidase